MMISSQTISSMLSSYFMASPVFIAMNYFIIRLSPPLTTVLPLLFFLVSLSFLFSKQTGSRHYANVTIQNELACTLARWGLI